MLLLMAGTLSAKPQAKYVFYFIGDGMGINQVLGAEIFRAVQKGDSLGYDRFAFSKFPVNTFATNKSASTYVTDSSAAGTALATGYKTNNSMLGVLPDGKTPVYSVATFAKKAGYKVGITSTVGVNHATPGAFYGHNERRTAYYEIGEQLTESGFDFFGAGGFLGESKNPSEKPYLKTLARDAGYTIAWGVDDYGKYKSSADKMILFQKDSTATELPFAIDRKADDLTLAQITDCAIDFLSKDNRKGFFLMVEGGKIDYAGHDNDAATAFKETEDFASAVDVAIEFYNKHPKETLIVVTADHETGGLALGINGIYALNYKVLQLQKASRGEMSLALSKLREQDKVTWEQAKSIIADYIGLWTKLPVTVQQEIKLMQVFDETFGAPQRPSRGGEPAKNSRNREEKLSYAAMEILYANALVSYSSGAHTGTTVPVFVMGAGAEKFMRGGLDNTDLPKIISEAAGYGMK